MLADVRKPTVVIPYSAPEYTPGQQDIFIYLRPETNGIETESSMMRTIQSMPMLAKNVDIAYLANIPGDFIVRNKIVEKHYFFKLYFARIGARAFTPYMKKVFKHYFSVAIEDVKVYGAFTAMRLMQKTPEELFHTWVSPDDLLIINGQSVKRIGDFFVINYDIPALLKRNNGETDIAVMILRSRLGYKEIRHMIEEMGRVLKEKGVVAANMPISRAFHYSKGPFEQLLDAMGYLYDQDDKKVPLNGMQFSKYLLDNDMTIPNIHTAIKHPIMTFQLAPGVEVEDDIFSFTVDDSYEEALDKYRMVIGQYVMH
jgi:hypothetical protein